MGRKRIEHKLIDGVECKYCGSCKQYLPLGRFSEKSDTWDRLQGRCKVCDRQSSIVYNANYTDRMKKRQDAFYQSWQRWAVEKFGHELGIDTCKDCDKNLRIQYHHRAGTKKEFQIQTFIRKYVFNEKNIARLEAELQKCDPLCEPCHVKRDKLEGTTNKRKRNGYRSVTDRMIEKIRACFDSKKTNCMEREVFFPAFFQAFPEAKNFINSAPVPEQEGDLECQTNVKSIPLLSLRPEMRQ